jgi:thioesterase domain-containing protein
MYDLLQGAGLNSLLRRWRRRRASRVLNQATFYLWAQANHPVPVDERSGRQGRLWIGGGAALRAVASHLGNAGSFVSLFLRQKDLVSLWPPYGFEEVAALMVEKILQLQPEGPYFVGGWCQEGLLAYEVARQIQERGCETRLLVMVDVPRPGSEKLSRAGKLVRRLQLEAFHLSVISGLPPRECQEYLAGRLEWFVADWKLRRWKGAYHGGRTQKRPPQSFAEVLELSAYNYKPLPYSGSVLFLQPQRRLQGALGTQRLAGRI